MQPILLAIGGATVGVALKNAVASAVTCARSQRNPRHG